jgi:apolipoprotein N-acyltransferase
MSSPEAAAIRNGRLLAGTAGLLLVPAYPIADLGFVAFVALVPLLLALRDVAPAEGARRGFAAGVVFFTLLLYWIVRVTVVYGHLSWPVGIAVLVLLVAWLAGWTALFGWLVATVGRRWGATAAVTLAPLLWVACEIGRGRALSGFPWGLAGYSQYRNLPLLQAASIGGVYLVSALVLAVNAGLVLILFRPRARAGMAAGAALLTIAAAGHGWGMLRLGSDPPPGPGIEVAAIQANVAQDRKWDARAQETILVDLERLTREAAASGARLVVWPESSSPLPIRFPPAPGAGPDPVVNRGYLDWIGRIARETGVTLIVGGVDYRRDGERLEALNSALVVGPDGLPGEAYAKVHLVPFGEYVPLRRVLFFVDAMVEGAIAGFAPGDRVASLPTPAGRAAVFVCYEAIFPELVRRLARDADLLVNVTNDAWFGRGAAPRQHLAIAALRAVEAGRDLVRAANTGISALVDRHGRIRARTPIEEMTILRGRLAVGGAARTLYARTGDRFAWGCVIVALVLGVTGGGWPRRRAR